MISKRKDQTFILALTLGFRAGLKQASGQQCSFNKTATFPNCLSNDFQKGTDKLQNLDSTICC